MPASSHKHDIFPAADADTCVKCALCLPHCPTYKLSLDEGESPRGRIALMQGLAGGELDDSEALRGHLDRCLGCRACEAVCPVPVPYGRLIDAGRHLLWENGGRGSWRARWILRLAPRRWFWRIAGIGSRLLKRLGLTHFFPFIGRAVAPRYRRGKTYPGYGKPDLPVVDLFLGCVADPFDARVHQASITLLTQLGYAVNLPAKQTCCGALHWHAGDRQTARRLAQQNQTMRTPQRLLISTATGCGAHLREYTEVLGETAKSFADTAWDINAFLAQADWSRVNFKPLAERVALHLPCTQRNVLKDTHSVEQLLQRIPDIELLMLAHKDCCGAAGVYFLNQPANARALGKQAAQAVKASGARLLVTANIGCAMQLQTACRNIGYAIEVLHPIELLAQQMKAA